MRAWWKVRTMVIGVASAVVAGMCTGFQSPTNASLGRRISVYRASLANFLVGWLTLLVLVLTAGRALGLVDYSQLPQVPWWQFLGGVYGSVMVVAMASGVPVLGAALTLTAVMLGQLAGGFVIDACGFLGVTRVPVSALGVIGCALVLLGIGAMYLSRMRQARASAAAGGRANGSPMRDPAAVALLAFCVAAGACAAMQAPTNAGLSRHVGALGSSLVNFTVGLLCCLLVVLASQRGRLLPPRGAWRGVRAWQLTGGLYGAAIVVLVIIATSRAGVGLTMSGQMLGQLLGGMLVDGFGWLQVPRARMDGWRVAGVLLIAAGIVVSALGR